MPAYREVLTRRSAQCYRIRTGCGNGEIHSVFGRSPSSPPPSLSTRRPQRPTDREESIPSDFRFFQRLSHPEAAPVVSRFRSAPHSERIPDGCGFSPRRRSGKRECSPWASARGKREYPLRRNAESNSADRHLRHGDFHAAVGAKGGRGHRDNRSGLERLARRSPAFHAGDSPWIPAYSTAGRVLRWRSSI